MPVPGRSAEEGARWREFERVPGEDRHTATWGGKTHYSNTSTNKHQEPVIT